MLEHRCAGALLLGLSLSDPWLAQLKGSRTPAVLYDNYVSANPATAYVGVDNFEAMRLAVAHLQGLGHRKIGYLSGFLGSFINQQRYDAFFQALRAHGLPHEESLGGSSSYTAACLETCLPALPCPGRHGHRLQPRPSGARADGARQGTRPAGAGGFERVGFDDLPLSAHTAPAHDHPPPGSLEIGRSAYHALKSLQGGIPISTILLHARLVERQSTAPPGLRP